MPMSGQRLCPDDLTVGLSELSAVISERDECDEQRTIWTPRRSTRCSAIPDQRDFRTRCVVELFITSNLKLTYYDPFDSPSFRSCLLMFSVYSIPAITSGNPVRFEDELFIHIGMIDGIGMMGSGVHIEQNYCCPIINSHSIFIVVTIFGNGDTSNKSYDENNMVSVLFNKLMVKFILLDI